MIEETRLYKSFFAVIIAVMFISLPFMVINSFDARGTPQISELPTPVGSHQVKHKVMADPINEIENIIWSIDETLMAKHIQKLQDFGTRYSYAVENCFAASEYIYSIFESNGLTTYYDNFSLNSYDQRNVVAELSGTSSPDDIYVICAHHDSTTSTPYKDAPGADDNGSGTAAVLAAAEVLSDYTFNCTIRFVTFSGEEQGLWGSKHYAGDANSAGENILGVINLDMIGFNPDPGAVDVVKARTNTQSEDLADFIVTTQQKYDGIINVSANKVLDASANSDHAAFWTYGYDAIHLFETRFGSNPTYHQITDLMDAINLTYAANITQIAIATLAELAQLNSFDIMPPVHVNDYPIPDSYGNATPTISIEITDPSLINSTSIRLYVEGFSVSYELETIPNGFNVSYYHEAGFADGEVVVCRIVADDMAGNGLDYAWTFTVDAVPPSPPELQIDLARIEGVKQGLAIDRGGTNDGNHAIAPSVIYQDGEYKMWYGGTNAQNYQILYANSSDGITWVKQGIAIPRGTTGQPDWTHASYCSVMYDLGEYKMWYSGSDPARIWRIMYANSSDGIVWTKQAVVLGLGSSGEYDDVYLFKPTVVKTDEYEMWYTGFDGINYRILYANSSDGINWNRLGSVVLDHSLDGIYDSEAARDPCVIKSANGYEMWFSGFDGLRYRVMYANSTDGLTWHRQGLAVDIGTGSDYDRANSFYSCVLDIGGDLKIWYSGYDGNYRILYSNISDRYNKTDIALNWSESSPDIVLYKLFRANEPSALGGQPAYLITTDKTLIETGLGDEDSTNYYYMVQAIDRAGNIAESIVVGKIGLDLISGWNLVSSPFFNNGVPLTDALKTTEWNSAQYYDASDPTDHWKTNSTYKPAFLNGLNTVNCTMALWVSVPGQDVYATVGQVQDISINMEAGWNLVSYPYHEGKMVQEALSGLPYTRVESFDPGEPYNLKVMQDTDTMYPGKGYWVYVTSATVWNAINI